MKHFLAIPFFGVMKNLAMLIFVAIWTIPTLGLLVSSVRDKEQLSNTGWWTAFFTSTSNSFGRLGASEMQTEEGGRFIIQGNLLEEELGVLTSFGLSINAPDEFDVGVTVDLDGTSLIVREDGSYKWSSAQRFEHERSRRIFYTVLKPPIFTLDNYHEVLTKSGLGTSFINSFTVVLPATFIPITIAAFAAYAFAWMRFRGRNWILSVVVGLLVVPLQMSLIPVLSFYNSVGAFFDVPAKGYLGIWLAHTGFGLPLAIYLLYNYMSSIPREIVEAAWIDGADHFEIFTRIMLPLSLPALASFGIFQFLWVWNDLLVALVFLGKSDSQIVLTSKLRELLGSYGGNWEILTASAFVTIAVPLVVFLCLQRYFVRGLLAGSVK